MIIIATHSFSLFDWSRDPVMADVLKRLFANGTVFFVFISGYLFQHRASEYRVLDYWNRKLKGLVVPYLVASIPAILFYTQVARRAQVPAGFYETPFLNQVFHFITTGSHLAPFWYIPTLMIFVAFAPVLHGLDRKGWLSPTLPALLLLPLAVARREYSPFLGFLHYLPAWVLGMTCSRYLGVQRWLRRRIWPLVLAAVLLFMAELLFAPGRYSWYSDLGKMALSMVFLELFRRQGSQFDHWFALPGTLSLGIYLIHSYLISAARIGCEEILGGLPSGGLVVFSLGAAMAITGSVAAANYIARKLGPLSLWIMGVPPKQLSGGASAARAAMGGDVVAGSASTVTAERLARGR